MEICTKDKRQGDTKEFSLFSGSVKCQECDGLFVFIGDEATARELVIRWGFKYQRGQDAERLKLRCEVKEKVEKVEPAEKKVEPTANTREADGEPAPKKKKATAKKKAAPKKKTPAKKKT